ncbi:hypothetical protein BH10ACI4_BH10ACI4_20720 [soil metagenome]
MQSRDLKDASFSRYPPQARALAAKEMPLLRELPLALAPILLRELIFYDWKMPAERAELNKQFVYLAALTPAERTNALEPFRSLSLSSELSAMDWVNDPAGFMERLAAWLWSTHQMERFRSIAEAHSVAVNAKLPDDLPSAPRLGIVIVGAGTKQSKRPLFQKLRPLGVHLTAVNPSEGFATLLEKASQRAARNAPSSSGFRHWYIDGGTAEATSQLTQISYAQLQPSRTLLLNRIQSAISSGSMGPEQLRTVLARMKPDEVGLNSAGSNEILNHFQLTLLTEGAGTQIFSTTFVQWAARECLRRAHPETLVVRYAPRQQAQTMNMMLSGASPTGLDPEGSLIDADMGAYYTWINMQRLSGADELRFLVWFEGQREALAIGPGLARGTSSNSNLNMHQILSLLDV